MACSIYSILFLVIFKTVYFNKIIAQNSQIECAEQIHRGCTNTYVPTPPEVEKARIYIQNKFMKESFFPPTAPPCPRLNVRRNFKCLTHEERLRVITVIQKLYLNGFMWELADIHAKCWVPWHKSPEGLLGHRWYSSKMEEAMREIDPDITLPYWKISEDCVSPHESLIWQYFGTTGTEATDWCVTDGPFTKQTEGRCIKRQWNPDGTISPWYCPHIENFGSALPLSLLSMFFFVPGQHFHPHLNIGGWHGHFSQNWAPYEYVYNTSVIEEFENYFYLISCLAKEI